MQLRKYNPADGQAYQGDVVILPLPEGLAVSLSDEIAMRGSMLVLAEGEVIGHHHAIRYGLGAAARFHDEGLARAFTVPASASHRAASPIMAATHKAIEDRVAPLIEEHVASLGISARLYRDPEALGALIQRGILTTDSLCIGFLVVKGDCPPLTHDEHAPIQIPPGSYYVGGKREMDAAEERRVAD